MSTKRNYRIEQRDASGEWSDDYTWNQGGNDYKTAEEAANAIKFLLQEYSDLGRRDFRISENS